MSNIVIASGDPRRAAMSPSVGRRPDPPRRLDGHSPPPPPEAAPLPAGSSNMDVLLATGYAINEHTVTVQGAAAPPALRNPGAYTQRMSTRQHGISTVAIIKASNALRELRVSVSEARSTLTFQTGLATSCFRDAKEALRLSGEHALVTERKAVRDLHDAISRVLRATSPAAVADIESGSMSAGPAETAPLGKGGSQPAGGPPDRNPSLSWKYACATIQDAVPSAVAALERVPGLLEAIHSQYTLSLHRVQVQESVIEHQRVTIERLELAIKGHTEAMQKSVARAAGPVSANAIWSHLEALEAQGASPDAPMASEQQPSLQPRQSAQGQALSLCHKGVDFALDRLAHRLRSTMEELRAARTQIRFMNDNSTAPQLGSAPPSPTAGGASGLSSRQGLRSTSGAAAVWRHRCFAALWRKAVQHVLFLRCMQRVVCYFQGSPRCGSERSTAMAAVAVVSAEDQSPVATTNAGGRREAAPQDFVVKRMLLSDNMDPSRISPSKVSPVKKSREGGSAAAGGLQQLPAVATDPETAGDATTMAQQIDAIIASSFENRVHEAQLRWRQRRAQASTGRGGVVAGMTGAGRAEMSRIRATLVDHAGDHNAEDTADGPCGGGGGPVIGGGVFTTLAHEQSHRIHFKAPTQSSAVKASTRPVHIKDIHMTMDQFRSSLKLDVAAAASTNDVMGGSVRSPRRTAEDRQSSRPHPSFSSSSIFPTVGKDVQPTMSLPLNLEGPTRRRPPPPAGRTTAPASSELISMSGREGASLRLSTRPAPPPASRLHSVPIRGVIHALLVNSHGGSEGAPLSHSARGYRRDEGIPAGAD